MHPKHLFLTLLLLAGCAQNPTAPDDASSPTDASTPPPPDLPAPPDDLAAPTPAPLIPLPADYPNLSVPAVGTMTLRIVSPTVLELERITTKAADPAPVTDWNFVGDRDAGAGMPAAGNFVVHVDGSTVNVVSVGFKRRVVYAPIRGYDLRIGNQLYLVLAQPIADGQRVSVEDRGGTLWGAPSPFAASMDPRRYGPAVHVNQVGYEPGLPKRAMVGYYLGDLGELKVAATRFSVVEAGSGKEVFAGSLAPRIDSGFAFKPAQYQQVLEADFTAFTTPGEYQLVVPGLGASYPFLVEDGVTMAFARTFAAGMYNQRCGVEKVAPYTRYVDGADHTAKAAVPTTDALYGATNKLIAANASVPQGQTAPILNSVSASLYPFVEAGPVDVAGGHHDAGDYSRYVFGSARLVHTLVFAADSLPSVGVLDNLGLPESGDGKSDVLQEAKWEADFLVKAQDKDGGFYTLVYPRDRAYEGDVLPSHGDPQVVWPKSTLPTAAAVAALAEIGSSPRFRQQFPADAARYLAAAQAGWNFLLAAIAKHGREGSWQYLYQYGSVFLQDDELDWAAAAMFVATGDAKAFALLQQWLPDPTSTKTFRWGWWPLWESYGSAIRDIAFAVRSGRRQPAEVDAKYLAQCEKAILDGARTVADWAKHSAYGTSFPDASKAFGAAGWYFSPTQAFDLAVGAALSPEPAFFDAILTNFNYEGGTNPRNRSFLSGLGFRRPREMVSQFFQNDRHRLPPTGIDLGNLVTGFQSVGPYGGTLDALTYPSAGQQVGPYAFYDRDGDAFNVPTESVTVNEAQGFAAIASIAGHTAAGGQPWTARAGTLRVGILGTVGQPMSAILDGNGTDLTRARVTWEARDQEPAIGGTSFAWTPRHGGAQWLEAEAVLPDGRRVIAVRNDLFAVEPVPAERTIEHFNAGVDLASSPKVVAWYPLDADYKDGHGKYGALAPKGAASIDAMTFAWPNRPKGGALRVHDLGDGASVTFTPPAFAGAAVSIEALVYVNAWKARGRGNAVVLDLVRAWNAGLGLHEDKWTGPVVFGGTKFTWNGAPLQAALSPGQWHHVRVTLDGAGYTVEIDGTVTASAASADLALWPASSVTLTIGDFDGWIDEVVVRNAK